MGKMVPLKINDKKINVALARTPHEQERGLQYKLSMPDDEGMLFCHNKPKKMNYWMKDTYIPLSIAFITADGRISQIEDMEPGAENRASSNIPCQYALETNKGWFEKNNIKPGDTVDLSLFNISEDKDYKKMKISKKQLRKIIAEEYKKLIQEQMVAANEMEKTINNIVDKVTDNEKYRTEIKNKLMSIIRPKIGSIRQGAVGGISKKAITRAAIGMLTMLQDGKSL